MSEELQGREIELAGDDSSAVQKRKYERNPNRVTCKARSKRDGTPCKNAPVAGATVCRMHGGAAPQVKAAARVRLEMAADRVAKELLGIAFDDEVSPAVKLAAVKDALDRAGVTTKAGLDVTVEVKPWEQIFESITRDTGDTGADAYARLLAEAEEEGDVVDAEVVSLVDPASASEVAPPVATGRPDPHGNPPDAHASEVASARRGSGAQPLKSAGESELGSLEDVTARAAEMNRRAGSLPPRRNGVRRPRC